MRRQKSGKPEKPLSQQVLQILLSLTDKRLHGYAIISDVADRTGSQVTLTAGTLYSALGRMLDAGLIEESANRPVPELDDERRRYYAITREGRQALRTEVERSERFVKMAHQKGILGRGRA